VIDYDFICKKVPTAASETFVSGESFKAGELIHPVPCKVCYLIPDSKRRHFSFDLQTMEKVSRDGIDESTLRLLERKFVLLRAHHRTYIQPNNEPSYRGREIGTQRSV